MKVTLDLSPKRAPHEPTLGAGKCKHPDLLRNTDEICRPLETPLCCTHRGYPDVPNGHSLDTPLVCLNCTSGHVLNSMLFEWRDGLKVLYIPSRHLDQLPSPTLLLDLDTPLLIQTHSTGMDDSSGQYRSLGRG